MATTKIKATGIADNAVTSAAIADGAITSTKLAAGAGAGGVYGSSSSPVVFTVTVASKTSAHPYNGDGSSSGYFLNGIESPAISLQGADSVTANSEYVYRFDQADGSNSGHPLLFYMDAAKTTAYTTGVTTTGTPGNAGAYTQIAVDRETPSVLYYQCSSHAYMGNYAYNAASTNLNGIKMPTADGSSGQVLSTNGSGVLSFATAKIVGLETIYVPAAAMYPNSTNGCADLEQVELSNGPELKCLDFDASSDENAQFTVCFPKSWNEGTVTFQAFWTVTGTNTGTVAWGLSGVCIADDASINTAFGTNVVATAKAFSGTSNDMTVSAVSGAVTIANAAVNTQAYFQVMRDVSADSQSGDARLLGIKLFFTTDAANDA